MERLGGGMQKSRKGEVWYMWRKEYSNREDRKKQKRRGFLSTL